MRRRRRGRRRNRIRVAATCVALVVVGAGVALLVSTWGDTRGMIRERIADRRETRMASAEPEEAESILLSETEPEVIAEPETIEDVWANDTREAVEVHGVYLSMEAAANREKVDAVIDLLDETEINAVVITVKNEDGYLITDMDVPLADEIGANDNRMFQSADDLRALVEELKEHGAYMIGRVVAFRDTLMANQRTDCSLMWNEEYGGGIYQDTQGYYWTDPGNETVREYLLDVSEATVDMGFDEIQYDYVRFPTSYIGRVETYGGVGYHLEDGVTYNWESANLRTNTITSFIEYVCRELVPQGVFVSADVYGTIISDSEDAGNVGQDYAQMSAWLDYICPMVYPSHYSDGYYGVDYPDTEPYTIVDRAMQDSKEVLSSLTETGEHCATVRPWLQTFTASWLANYISYGGTQLREQVNAVYDEGYDEWLLWQSSANYGDYRSGILANGETETAAERAARASAEEAEAADADEEAGEAEDTEE